VGAQRPINPDLNGDESAVSPRQAQPGILGHLRGTDQTKRIETDAQGNLYAHVATDDTAIPSAVNALASGSITAIPDATIATIVTYTAASAKRVTRIACSGTIYGTYQLFLNTGLIETKRSSPDRSIEFMFSSPLQLNASDILDVKVTHYYTSHLEDFNSTVYGA
jgi:hypothetical protein